MSRALCEATCAGRGCRDGAQEAGFRQSWAAQKLPCDCALAAVFLAMAGLREARACILAGVRAGLTCLGRTLLA